MDVAYPQAASLFLSLLVALPGGETNIDITLFGGNRQPVPPFSSPEDGVPAHEHLGDILAVPERDRCQHCFAAWIGGQRPEAAKGHRH